MTESFVTQCPHCQTSFRVSRAQLGAAQGAVRCGACLHVFNAAKQLLGAMPPSEPKPTTPAPQAPRPAAPPPAKPATPGA
ncbi:MJ0042-type zinc finger domain-containing protein, partial [Pseudomonas sp. 2023EL-01195]